MSYNLGPVKPHVAVAANEIGTLFKVVTVYGYGLRPQNPSSDHPKGLALDFMVYTDKAKGDAISQYGVSNASRLKVKYIIWYRQIWYPGKGWSAYSGYSPHTDHPHFSFYASTDAVPEDSGSGGSAPWYQPTAITEAGKAVSWITNPRNWLRIAMVVAGVVLILIALWNWDKVKNTAMQTVRKVTK
jgi:hypothetical protein